MDNNRFNYMLLDRLRQDCDYYLRNPGTSAARQLWAQDEQSQIDKMRELWDGFAANAKPEWLSRERIEEYARQMGAN